MDGILQVLLNHYFLPNQTYVAMPIRPIYRHCQRCDEGFSTFEESKIYCSDACELREKLKKNREEAQITFRTKGSRKCLGCGEYFVRASYADYCNVICWHDKYKAAKRQETIDKNNAIEKTCPACNHTFRSDRANIKYCSTTCSEQKNRENLEKLNAKQAEERAKAGKKRKKIPYHILNLMAEKKRLDEDWDRLTR